MKVAAGAKEKNRVESTPDRKLKLVPASPERKGGFRIDICDKLFSSASESTGNENPEIGLEKLSEPDSEIAIQDPAPSSGRQAVILGLAGGLIVGYLVGRRSR